MASGASASADAQIELARHADERGDATAALTYVAAACALGGRARDWLALAERIEGDDALRALSEALDALDEREEGDAAEVSLGVAERALRLDLEDVAEDGLGVALGAGPEDALRRRFLRALRELHEGNGAPAEQHVAGRNDPCPCGSGRKFKRCHADAARPPARPHASDGSMLIRLVTPYVDDSVADAVRMLETVKRWVPRDPAVNVLTGLIAAARGEGEDARRQFRLAARGTERDIEVGRELLRGAIRVASRDRELALEMLRIAPPAPEPVSLALAGGLFLALGYPREATPLLERAVRQQDDPAQRDTALRTLARAAFERGEHHAALGALDALAAPSVEDRGEAVVFAAWAGDPSAIPRAQALRAEGIEDEAAVGEGVAALIAGDNERAVAALARSGDPVAHHWRAEALEALGRDAEARAARQECASAAPLDSDEFALGVECVLAVEGPGAARRRAEMYGFTGILPLRAIGRIALRLGERDEADAAARHLREEAGGDVEALLFCADWHAVRGEIDAALADVDAALAAQPGRHRIRFARASLLQQARRTEQARTVLADLVRQSHGNGRYRAALAVLLDEVGEVAAARRQWREAHRSAPDVPSVARAVGRLEGEERALVRAREDAQRSVASALGAALEALDADARAALIGAEQDWRSLDPTDDHSTVVTQLAKAIEIELMRRVFAPFRSRGAALSDAQEDVGGFGKWCRGEIPSLSLGEMAFAFGGLARDDVSPLLDAFRTHVATATDATYDLGERLAMPLRALAARRNAAVHKERVSRAEAEDSRRSVLGREGRRGLIVEIVDRFGAG